MLGLVVYLGESRDHLYGSKAFVGRLPRCLGDLFRLLRLVVDAGLLTRRAFSTGLLLFSFLSLHWQSCLPFLLLGELCLFPFPILFIAELLWCAGWYVLPSASWPLPLVSMMMTIHDGIFIIAFSFGCYGSSPLLMPRLTSAYTFTCFGSAMYTISKVNCMSPPPCTTLLAMTMSWSWVSCYFGAAMMMFNDSLSSEDWWKQYVWATIWDPLPALQNHDWHLWIPTRYILCSFVKSHLLIDSSPSSLILHL